MAVQALGQAAPLVLSEEEVVRFDIHQRIQHILMMVSFIALALTGLPQKFFDLGLSQWWITVLGGIETVRSAHRFFAWIMALDCFYHVAYISYGTLVLRKPFPLGMLPNLKDVADMLQDLRYFVGLTRERPQFTRFDYHQKFDYWAIFWGVPIMGITGLIMMYPVFFTRFLPGVIVPAAQVAHSDEAILAILWILIVHMYYVHLAPHVFPFNASIFTGKLAAETYRLEHPLEYGGMAGGQVAEPQATDIGPQRADVGPQEADVEPGSLPRRASSPVAMLQAQDADIGPQVADVEPGASPEKPTMESGS